MHEHTLKPRYNKQGYNKYLFNEVNEEQSYNEYNEYMFIMNLL